MVTQDHSGSDSLSLPIQIQNFNGRDEPVALGKSRCGLRGCVRVGYAACTPLGADSVCSDRALSRSAAVVSCVAVLVLTSCGALNAWRSFRVLRPHVVAFPPAQLQLSLF